MAAVAGNLFELKQFSGLRILDVRLPDAFARACPGPRFGVEGTRKLAGVQKRPLIGTIVKPSIGFAPQQTADLVDVLCGAGIDFIKDDELQSDGPTCPFDGHASAVMQVINRHAGRSGRKVMFAFNLTGEIDEMRRRHDLVESLGGTCVMASLNSVGVADMIALGRHARLPIHAHRNGWGYLSRHPALGWSYVARQKIWRFAGVDHMHVNGLANKFSEPIGRAIDIGVPIFSKNPGAADWRPLVIATPAISRFQAFDNLLLLTKAPSTAWIGIP
jgi:ribulose-bisphosphate carboxylase large chain